MKVSCLCDHPVRSYDLKQICWLLGLENLSTGNPSRFDTSHSRLQLWQTHLIMLNLLLFLCCFLLIFFSSWLWPSILLDFSCISLHSIASDHDNLSEILNILWLYLMLHYRIWRLNINTTCSGYLDRSSRSLLACSVQQVCEEEMAAANPSSTSSGQVSVKKKWVNSCCAAYCSATTHLSQWPKAKNDSDYWTSWVLQKNRSFTLNSKSRLCCKHFKEDCFSNLYKYVMGYDTK